MRTRRNISIAWVLASLLPILPCRRSTSATWSPTVKAGLSEVIGSWKIIERRAPRSSLSRVGGSFSRSSPSKRTSPETMRPGGCGTRPMMLSAVTLLPQPDSPTIPSVRPLPRLKSTPSTARTSPSSESKTVVRPLTSSSVARSDMPGDFVLDRLALEEAPRPRLARAAGHEGDEALVCLLVQPAQLREGIGVVVDAQAQLRIRLRRMDEERRRLLASLVSAGRLAGVQCAHQSLGERQRGISQI